MSYDKKIGLLRGTSSDPFLILPRMGVQIIPHDLKKLLPKATKEPEPKIWLPRQSSFMNIRGQISNSANALILPDQFWAEKFPLVSVLTDTRKGGFPTAKLDQQHYSMRLRYEVDPVTGKRTQYDFNEKSAMAIAQMIGGLQDRDEREHDFPIGTTFEDGYNQFIQKYRDENDRAKSDDIPYSEHHVFGGYIAARSEYGFIVAHPEYPVAAVFEACEDVYDTYLYDMCQATQNDVCEFEFEAKQIWGELPAFATKSPKAFRSFLYSWMIEIRDHIAMATPGAMVNLKSKAENTKEHLEHHVQSGKMSDIGLTNYYQDRIPTGYSDSLTPLQSSLMMGHTIEKTLDEADRYIAHRCGEMHHQKVSLNRDYKPPSLDEFGNGQIIIGSNDNQLKTQATLIANGPR